MQTQQYATPRHQTNPASIREILGNNTAEGGLEGRTHGISTPMNAQNGIFISQREYQLYSALLAFAVLGQYISGELQQSYSTQRGAYQKAPPQNSTYADKQKESYAKLRKSGEYSRTQNEAKKGAYVQ